MIAFFNETSFAFLYHKNKVKQWVKQTALSEEKKIGDINYIFCSDVYLYKINVQYLQYNTLTDTITFDYTEGITPNSDVYISIEGVRENADILGVTFEQELLRMLAHGILHLCGYKDKTPADSESMRAKEDEKTKLFSL